MIRHQWLSFVVAGGLLGMGCAQQTEQAAKEAEKAAGSAESAARSASEAAKRAGESATEAAKDAAEAGAGAAREAASKLGGEFSSALDHAKSAIKDVPGGSEAVQKVNEIFTGASQALAGATSSETAQTAMSKLAEVEGKVDGALESLKKLPAGARTAIAGLVEKGVAHLRTLSEKVKGLEGVDEQIKTRLDNFLAKVERLKE